MLFRSCIAQILRQSYPIHIIFSITFQDVTIGKFSFRRNSLFLSFLIYNDNSCFQHLIPDILNKLRILTNIISWLKENCHFKSDSKLLFTTKTNQFNHIGVKFLHDKEINIVLIITCTRQVRRLTFQTHLSSNSF